MWSYDVRCYITYIAPDVRCYIRCGVMMPGVMLSWYLVGDACLRLSPRLSAFVWLWLLAMLAMLCVVVTGDRGIWYRLAGSYFRQTAIISTRTEQLKFLTANVNQMKLLQTSHSIGYTLVSHLAGRRWGHVNRRQMMINDQWWLMSCLIGDWLQNVTNACTD